MTRDLLTGIKRDVTAEQQARNAVTRTGHTTASATECTAVCMFVHNITCYICIQYGLGQQRTVSLG